MERLVQATSGYGPVNTTAINSEQNPKKNDSKEWNCYRDCVSKESIIHNFNNFKKSQAPERLMEWSDEKWVELPSHVVSSARSAFSKGIPIIEVEVEGDNFMFDFYRMLKIEIGSSGLQRSIAWIDIKGSCFFPKFFVDESLVDNYNNYSDGDEELVGEKDECSNNGINPKIEIEINIDNINNVDSKIMNNNDKKRKREGKVVVHDVEDTADSRNSGTGSERFNIKRNLHIEDEKPIDKFEWPSVRLINEQEKAFSDVKKLFLGGMKMVDSRVEVTAIHKLTYTGPHEKARAMAFHKTMQITQAARGGQSNTVFAWHGTSRKGVSDILAHGFGVPSKVSGLQAHGVGVYLSPGRLPHLSDLLAQADDNGEKHVLLCRVVLGNLEKIDAGSQQFSPSSTAFDNGVDDTVNPKWFVVWTTNMNTHILPECVVSYKCSNVLQGTKEGEEEVMKWAPEGPSKLFFSQLGIALPASKLEELKALCRAFKAGELAKDLFVQRLKSVVGNEMLYSAMARLQVKEMA
ncbi:probable inactive poly [ADP-ribose] polymerase SRO3 isoform X2 [Amaranthus tricolor]|uniref:probable inactive poly [ADP-ribose] polymerase SRO3 isoform X2 n=1 Tax=Amaranthus tricolor TaxID=29722 RepID=UPI002590988E|nr:probable inactive poly [ADP-ribose] polymerase SRO3 isoform X2 [Amaranthus tricolor]